MKPNNTKAESCSTEIKNCIDTVDGQKPVVISGDQPAQRLNRKRREPSQNNEFTTEGFEDLKESLEATKHDKARADLFSKSLEEYSHLIHTEIVSFYFCEAHTLIYNHLKRNKAVLGD